MIEVDSWRHPTSLVVSLLSSPFISSLSIWSEELLKRWEFLRFHDFKFDVAHEVALHFIHFKARNSAAMPSKAKVKSKLQFPPDMRQSVDQIHLPVWLGALFNKLLWYQLWRNWALSPIFVTNTTFHTWNAPFFYDWTSPFSNPFCQINQFFAPFCQIKSYFTHKSGVTTLSAAAAAVANAVFAAAVAVQSGWSGCRTGNGEKLSSSQAQPGKATSLAVA